MRCRRPSGGFTLIEVLLALVLLSLAAAIVYSSLSTSLMSWNAGLEKGRRDQVARIALDRMSQQLRSAVPAQVEKDGRRVAALDAGEDFIRFVTPLAAGSDRPLAQVLYAVEEGEAGSELVYREFPWPDKDFFSGGTLLKEERIPEIEGFTIALQKVDEEEADRGEEPGEEDQWSPGEEASLPSEASITLTVEGGGEGPSPYSATVPLMAGTGR